MRLTSIKLAGFKSFVDPTALHLPTNMTGIVGPNGCGKSNIIDAIRWVMGESAASRLRGDALTDVIFSGSSARKPVGQASVELVFDNSDGTIGGEFASYTEIAVKRVVDRDGQSQYMLNGTHCRRRDITDLFLGTGLGPRSYSIIEQGTISQIVEAKPEQLRAHLEEAAGISKYKERRRETESRIKSTRENLDRVNDVREEVAKQLERLDRQAKAASRWQKLKQEQTHQHAQLQALQYRSVAQRRGEQAGQLSRVQTDIERVTAQQRHCEAELEGARQSHQKAGETLNTAQAEVYRIGGEIARIEQQIEHHRQLQQQLQKAQGDLDGEFTAVADDIRADREQLDALHGVLADAAPRQQTAQQQREQTEATRKQAEAELSQWQTRHDAQAHQAAEAGQAAGVERTRLAYLDEQTLDNQRRADALAKERGASQLQVLEDAVARLTSEQEHWRGQVTTLGAALASRKAELETLQKDQHALDAELDAERQQSQVASGRIASLKALQQAALGQEDSALGTWLEHLDLGGAKRVGEVVQVDPGWELAVETVLEHWLDGVVTPQSPAGLDARLNDAPNRTLLVSDALANPGQPHGDADYLADHVRAPAVIVNQLAGVLTAPDLASACVRATTLAPGQSIAVASGEWLGAGWVRIHRDSDAGGGVLARERALRELDTAAAVRTQHIAQLVDRRQTLERDRLAAEQAYNDEQRLVYEANRRFAEISGQLEGQRGKIDSVRARGAQIATELAALEQARGDLAAQSQQTRGRLDTAVASMAELEDQRAALDAERRQLLEQREEARFNATTAAEQAQGLAVDLEAKKAAAAGLEQALARLQARSEQLGTRRREIAAELEQGGDPTAELTTAREACLGQRLTADQELVAARQGVEAAEAEFRHIDQQRQTFEQQVTELREAHAEQRLALQALELQADQLATTITGDGQDLESLLSELPEDVDEQARRKDLEDLAMRITRMEPVNLAAINEYDEQAERKQYLDAQIDDLTSALTTLENAITKIDHETRERFSVTFDQVNAGLKELFPRLFGGGQAYLELTGKDLLDTGVTIMARPPGKRVSSISLLSGGEKAMTAVALVFAIFRLNPAPFCLLDEVDAPLDESSVGRFSSMVEEMSEQVQFIFISHNKAAMEVASQLCGVTMREPGVSRLVEVDLTEASKLAATA